MRTRERNEAAARLDELRSAGWRVLHDVRWPGRPRAGIDHVLVGPGGVVVLTCCDGTRGSGDGTTAAEREEALVAAAAVSALLEPPHRRLVTAALCPAGLERSPAPVGGTVVVGLDQVVPWCAELPKALAPGDVASVADRVERLLGGRTTPAQVTPGHVLAAPARRAEASDAAHRRGRPVPAAARPSVPRTRQVAVALLVGLALVAVTWQPIASGVDSFVASYLAVASTGTVATPGVPGLPPPPPPPREAPSD